VEKLQLWPMFPGKRLIKTYDGLWESCRSIAPLQLCFLEIFDLVVTFGSYAISKQGKWKRAGPVSALSRRPRATASHATRHPRVPPAYGRFGASAVDLTRCGPSTPLSQPCAEPRRASTAWSRALPAMHRDAPCRSVHASMQGLHLTVAS
jgi:hypothetical protein